MKYIYPYRYKRGRSRVMEFLKDETKRSIFFLLLGGLSLLVSFFEPAKLPFDAAWVAVLCCGLPIIKEAALGLVREFDIKADVLVSLALIASVIIGEIFAAGEVAFIMQIGSFLEERTVEKARAGIEKLVRLTPRTARIVEKDGERILPAQEVQVGQILRVLPGETVPVDGRILEGVTSVDQSVMTGESLPVDRKAGDPVFSGTVNQFGAFSMRADKVGEDSSIQRMIRLVQSADAGKAKIVTMADRWATWIVVIALTAALGTWLVTGEVIRGVTILVVFCPCALVLATPTAIMAAIGNATKHGFLVREGDALERLAQVKQVAFDKTGTLTFGHPQVKTVECWEEGLTRRELYCLAAAAELRSEHPLGKAVVAGYRQEFSAEEGDAGAFRLPEPKAFAMLPGRGVLTLLPQGQVIAGNRELLAERQITLPSAALEAAMGYEAQGCTIIFLARGGSFCGFLALADLLRPDAAAVVEAIRDVGVIPALLTGDNQQAAGFIAGQAGIDEVKSRCLPEEKLEFIEQAQKEGRPVCMIGDGINDAPALKKAFVGIAMGGVGSDIAVEAADIALINDEIRQLPHLLLLSRRMMTTIRCNLTFSMTLNFLAIFLAMAGILNPVWGALVHNAGSVLVIVNSSLLLGWKKKRVREHSLEAEAA